MEGKKENIRGIEREEVKAVGEREWGGGERERVGE